MTDSSGVAAGARLILGTHNRKKAAELIELLSPLGIEIRTLADQPQALEVAEDGATFQDNARKKASVQALHLTSWVLGEDSGLSVDALGGAPGVHSARYAGPGASDGDNNRRLLEAMHDVPDGARQAHYVCHVSLSDPRGRIRAEAEDRCAGRVRRTPVGSGGFGYDPLFEIVEYHRTFAELGGAVKWALSHRGRAMRRLCGEIASLLTTDGSWVD
jgi:XTP/dITP diphosphohydrolase